jgi:hypothetical protein
VSGEADRTFIVVLGAARSGTSMLRDLIAAHPAVTAIPFDVNHIWRIGNDKHPDDMFLPESATPDIGRTIRGRLTDIARRNAGETWPDVRFIVEKTVGNALRPEFVERVLPDAIFVRILRDPRRVIASTIASWRAPPNTGHLMRKLKLFGPADLNYMGWYALNAVKGRFGHKRGLQIWGARYPGIRRDLETQTLETVCARQWLASATTIDRFFATLPPERGISVSYEALIGGPHELRRLWEFLGISDDERAAAIFADRIRPSGNLKETLPEGLECETRRAVEARMAEYGYS